MWWIPRMMPVCMIHLKQPDPVTLVFYNLVGTSLSHRIGVECKGKIGILPQSLVCEHIPDTVILWLLLYLPHL